MMNAPDKPTATQAPAPDFYGKRRNPDVSFDDGAPATFADDKRAEFALALELRESGDFAEIARRLAAATDTTHRAEIDLDEYAETYLYGRFRTLPKLTAALAQTDLKSGKSHPLGVLVDAYAQSVGPDTADEQFGELLRRGILQRVGVSNVAKGDGWVSDETAES